MQRYLQNALISVCLLAGTAFAQPKATQQAILRPAPTSSGYDFGKSLSLSADGNTALIGNIGFDQGRGAAHVYVRSGTSWAEQTILTVNDTLYSAPSQQLRWLGSTVSLSDDGNTALVCAPGDANYPGTAWIFTREAGVWRRTARLRPSDPTLFKFAQGGAISGNGSTIVVSSYFASSGKGAAWVYTKSNDQWVEQAKLTANNYAGSQSYLGYSVAVSQDGNSVLLGAPIDNNFVGAAWTFQRTGSSWVQCDKLVGTDYTGASAQGQSVALSSTGSTALVGATYNNNYPNLGPKGASWIFEGFASQWTETAGPLVGSESIGDSYQGEAVALSGDGRLAAVGGFFDDTAHGATWLFIKEDEFPSKNQSFGGWQQWGSKLVATGAASAAPRQGERLALSRDGSTLLVSGRTDYASDSITGSVWAFSIIRSTTSVEAFSDEASGLGVFPNPASAGGQVWIRNPALGVPAQIDVVDVFGRSVHSLRTTSDQPWIELTTPALSQGLYVIEAVASGRRMRGRLIVR